MNVPWALIDSHLDGTLSDADAMALGQWLSEDRANLLILARAAHDHAALEGHFRTSEIADLLPTHLRSLAPILRAPAIRCAVGALAAGLAIILSLQFLPTRALPVSPELAEVTGSLVLERDGQSSPALPSLVLQPGDVLRTFAQSR